MTRRRSGFFVTLALAILVAPLGAEAPPPGKISRWGTSRPRPASRMTSPPGPARSCAIGEDSGGIRRFLWGMRPWRQGSCICCRSVRPNGPSSNGEPVCSAGGRTCDIPSGTPITGLSTIWAIPISGRLPIFGPASGGSGPWAALGTRPCSPDSMNMALKRCSNGRHTRICLSPRSGAAPRRLALRSHPGAPPAEIGAELV